MATLDRVWQWDDLSIDSLPRHDFHRHIPPPGTEGKKVFRSRMPDYVDPLALVNRSQIEAAIACPPPVTAGRAR